MTLTPRRPVRGSRTGRPVMALLDLIGRRWSLRVLWELREAPCSFRALQSRCDEVSPSVLNTRLAELRAARLVEASSEGYRLTAQGRSLGAQIMKLSAWAERWAADEPTTTAVAPGRSSAVRKRGKPAP